MRPFSSSKKNTIDIEKYQTLRSDRTQTVYTTG
nr:MAG TPA: hypothetical protein [Caudoviricetes sp.]